MYNVKGPSKIVTKTTRRGIPQNMGEYNRNKSVENEEPDVVPKPVFHNKKSSPCQHKQEVISPQHEEIIKFINESWDSAYTELCQNSGVSPDSEGDQSVYYKDGPSVIMDGFKPFDLEAWWGKRLYAHITGTNNKN